MNITTNVDLNNILGITIAKTIEFYKIKTTEEETNKFINELLSSDEFLNAFKNSISVHNESSDGDK